MINKIINKTVKYGLVHKATRQLLQCNGTWLVDDPLVAEYVRNYSTEWYNAEYRTPSHEFEADELKVVKVTITEEYDDLNVEIPSFEEYIEKKYKKENPEHYYYLMKQYKEYGNSITYSLYDLLELNYKKE